MRKGNRCRACIADALMVFFLSFFLCSMNAVVGLSRLLSATDLSLEQQQYVSMITSSSHVLLHIVNDILDYSRIEAGQTRIQPIVHNLIDTIETASMLVYGLAQAKHLQIAWTVEETDLPSKLLVDAPRLQQIIINLLSNGKSRYERDIAQVDGERVVMLFPTRHSRVILHFDMLSVSQLSNSLVLAQSSSPSRVAGWSP